MKDGALNAEYGSAFGEEGDVIGVFLVSFLILQVRGFQL